MLINIFNLKKGRKMFKKFTGVFIAVICGLVLVACDGVSSPSSTATKSQYAYVANISLIGGNINAYKVNTNGAMTFLSVMASQSGYFPRSITLDPANTHAYVSLSDPAPDTAGGYINVYNINSSTGALALVQQESIESANPLSDSGTQGFVVSGNYTESLGYIYSYSVDTTSGKLNLESIYRTESNLPSSAVVSGSQLYISGYVGESGFVSSYLFDSAGSLTPESTLYVSGYNKGSKILLHPSGNYGYVYVAEGILRGGDESSVLVLSIESGTGILKLESTFVTSTYVNSMAVDKLGKYAYIGTSDYKTEANQMISTYSIESGGGVLSYASNVATLHSPVAIALDPYGNYADVALLPVNNDNAPITSFLGYSINSANGALSTSATPGNDTSGLSFGIAITKYK